jgi:voltage-gated potassium channel
MAPLPFKPFAKVYISMAVFVLILLLGTVGYMMIEGYEALDALYMTVITLATVGFSEVKPLSHSGRIFTIILILANIGTFTYFITQISSYFLDGEFSKVYKTYKMKSFINDLSGHVILCGFGRNGREAAKILHGSNLDFVVIEKVESRTDNLPYPVKHYMVDDATQDEVLIEAGIARAKALITTLPDDADNLFVVLTARELNPGLKIITRASHDSSIRKLKMAGANNIIMPDKIGGVHMASMVAAPDIKEFMDLMTSQHNAHFSVTEIESNKNVTLEELDCWNKTGATILGIKSTEGEYAINPVPKTILLKGHKLIVMGSKDQLDKVKGVLN